MFSPATRVLRLVFTRSGAALPSAPSIPLAVEVIGYCQDFLFSGILDLDADRLTDLLNGCDEIELIDVVLQWLDDGRVLTQERTTIPRASLLAVKAGDPRGNPARRRLTRPAPVVGLAGPYEVEGYLHSPRGASPGEDLARRASMVPLTDASIRFTLGGQPVAIDAATLIVNRDAAADLRVASHEQRLASA